MLDCGFSISETKRRLARMDMMPSDLSGIIVTHEHSDHAGGVIPLARRHKIPVWMSYGTYLAYEGNCEDIDIRFCRDGDRVVINDLQLTAFTVPHDAREPLQFHITNGRYKLGVLTDIGQVTAHMIHALSACDLLVLECNHDLQMLANSTYPQVLKKRISGGLGHLSNKDAAGFLAMLDQSKLKKVVGAHLSQQNNRPDLVKQTLYSAMNLSSTEVVIADQEKGFEWIETE